MSRPIPKRLGIVLLSGFVLLTGAIGLEISFGKSAGLAEVSGLLVLTGFFVAGVFAYAGLRAAGDQREVLAPLYSADLIGGCLASILASLVLAPVVGLAQTAYVMMPLAMFSVLLL
jgi:CBS domain containing-hemolysin-like protein